jgi:hypothetical protein
MRTAGIDGDNIKMYLKKWGGRVWTELIWSSVQYSGGLLHKYGKGPLGSVQRGGPAKLMTRTVLGPPVRSLLRRSASRLLLLLYHCVARHSVAVHLVLQTYRWLCLNCLIATAQSSNLGIQ